ncbi:hypothetical protein ElyMa_005040600 [Elysia marginata]|uniref:Uncharacterized protein n=1 Tax=Elysia marginata TaxID=1093978 RepID=A0AAV4JCJ2_9GAST|nr:hypothetical protein ElyMa_005040600 [Elysia marginata]
MRPNVTPLAQKLYGSLADLCVTAESICVANISLKMSKEDHRRGRLVDCLNFNVSVNFEVISETALGTIESVLPHWDVKSACVHHTQSHYPDNGPTRLNTKFIMPKTKRFSC